MYCAPVGANGHARTLFLALTLALCAACSGGSELAPRDATLAESGIDATIDRAVPRFDIPPADRSTLDVTVDAFDGTCALDRDCPRGQRCLQNRCAEDVCLADENPCGPERCEMRCVPSRNLCGELNCAPGETCLAGRCVAGCFPSPCADVTCPAGQFCDESTGACARVTACPGACRDGFTCHVACVPRSPCDGVDCPAGTVCFNGECRADACAAVTCAEGSICIDGACVATCACDPPCTRSPRDRCEVGRCVCNRTCTPESRCGDDDGCGGRCVGQCEYPNATCDRTTFSCDCVPRCDTTSSCGQDDGCGGRCEEGCPPGWACDAVLRHCVCLPHCRPADRFNEVPCGDTVPNECEGGGSCGTGTGCPEGLTCSRLLSRCVCEGPGCPTEMSDAGTIEDVRINCPVGLTACDGRCVDTTREDYYCGGCTYHCPMVSHCVNSVCRCPDPFTLCGVRCVDTRSESGNCGRCGTVCAAGTACVNGVCQCDQACAVDLGSVPCGTNVPNRCPGGPSCGTGRMCPSGQTCDPRVNRCVCVPRCPSGVACGTSDGCGGTCVGACATGTCTQDMTDTSRYFCSAASCASGCRCDEVCVNNACTRVTCAGGGTPCPCQCCAAGEMCVGGSRCVVIPP